MGTITKGLISPADMSLWDGTAQYTFSRATSTGGSVTLKRVDWPGVDILQVYGAGTTRTDATISAAMAAIGAINKAALFISPGTWTISNDITVTSNFTLVVPPGASLNPASGKTLTLQCAVDAGPYQIFGGAGTVTSTSVPGARWGQWSSGGSDVLTVTALTIGSTSVSAFAKTLLDDANAAAARTTLGLGTAAVLDVGVTASKVVQLDAGAKLPAIDGSQLTGLTGGASTALFRSYLAGMQMALDTDTDHDIAIAVGECRDDTDAYNMALSAVLTKRIDAAWAVGDDAGGLDTGTVAADTWYHIYAIYNATSLVTDALFTATYGSPTMPSGYGYKRRLGSVLTDGSANILAFIQHGDMFYWSDPIDSISDAAATSTPATNVVHVPTGLKVVAVLNVAGLHASVAGWYVFSPDISAEAANAAGVSPGAFFANVAGAYGIGGPIYVLTDTSAQVSYASSQAGNGTIKIITLGWVDARGRDD